MAVIGACVAPATKAPIPTSAKAPGEDMEFGKMLLKKVPITFPVIAPKNREGAKIPPDPPDPRVKEVLRIFAKMRINASQNPI